MDSHARFRVILPCRRSEADIFRTLASLASQTVGPERQSVILASGAPAEHANIEPQRIREALGFSIVELLDCTGLTDSRAINAAAAGGSEDMLVLAPEGARLSSRFLEACLKAIFNGKAEASFPLHTAGTPDSSPLSNMRPFSGSQLFRYNPVGPATLVSRQAWTRLDGLRSGTGHFLWEFWLRLSLSGGRISQVRELLAHCPPRRRQSHSQDGQAKALLVTGAPGAFHPDTCRWALALLRGESWARPFTLGIIPNAAEVRAMHTEAARQSLARGRIKPELLTA